jgi:hypothetical protein
MIYMIYKLSIQRLKFIYLWLIINKYMVNNIPIGLVHRFLKIESNNGTKSRRFLMGSVRF